MEFEPKDEQELPQIPDFETSAEKGESLEELPPQIS